MTEQDTYKKVGQYKGRLKRLQLVSDAEGRVKVIGTVEFSGKHILIEDLSAFMQAGDDRWLDITFSDPQAQFSLSLEELKSMERTR